MIRLIIADDHELVRQGLRRVIERQPGMEVVAEAQSGQEVVELVETRECDVLVLDISMPGPGFLSTLERVRALRPRLPVLVLSVYPEEDWALRALRAGAAGYLSKTHSVEELTAAIGRLQRGGRYVSEALAERLAFALGPDFERPAHEVLSNREYEVLCLLAQGKLVKEIAARLGISPRTVTTYRARLLQKLGLTTTADLIRYVVEHDLRL
jgi:DNA-binding NarL/FixJ family response regulator